MAEGFLRSFDRELEVYSAGTKPEHSISSYAVDVMKELGIDISKQYPKNVEIFLNENFDYVMTVCDSAKESCPVFPGNVKHSLHIGFEDPAGAAGSKDYILSVYRKVRDNIKEHFGRFYAELKKTGVLTA